MKVTLFLTADLANMDTVSGKLNIIGAFREIRTLQLPCTMAQIYLVLQLSAFAEESGHHKTIYVRLLDPDGEELAVLPHEFDLPKIPYAQHRSFNIIFNIQNLTFNKFGTYEFKVYEQEQAIDSCLIEVMVANQERV